MTNDDVIALGKKAYACARKKLSREDAEEIAGDVVEHVITKDLKEYVVQSLVIDMARKRWGREDSPNATVRKNLYFGQVGSTTEFDGTPKVVEDTAAETPLEIIESRESYERVRQILTPIRCCIVTLYVKYGFTSKEIAHCFNLSESWVSMELNKCGAKAERFKILTRRSEIKNP